MQRAEHSRFFRGIYRTRTQRDNFRSVIVSIYGIYFAVCVCAFKHFVCSFANIIAGVTRLRRICGWNNNQRNTIKLSLVRYVCSQLVKIPLTKFSLKLFVSAFACKSYSYQILNCNSLILRFSRLNNLFCNGVIYNTGMSSFFAGKPFKKFSRITSAFALNRTPNLLPMFTVFVKSIGRELNIIRCVSYCCEAKIHPKKGFNIINIFFGYVNGLKKVKLTFLVNQIGFTFNIGDIISIVANKGYFQSTTNSPQRNHVVRLVGHYSTVISNTTERFKCAFSFLVQLISISNLCYLSYKHLGRKIERSLIGMIRSVMEFKIIENLLLPRHIRNSITNNISFLHRIEKQVSLFIGRQKFYFQCKFHLLLNTHKNTKSFLYQKIILNLFNFKGVSVSLTSHPHFVMSGFHAPIL